MIPLRDDAPRGSYPYVTVLLIAVNVAVYAYQLKLSFESPGAVEAFVYSFGAVPAKVSAALAGEYSLKSGLAPLLSSIFLHGGFLHLLGNMWFLWVFGDNVEDELGHFRYVFFYLGCGLIASLAHFLANPASNIPALGASGAIAGVMGAYVVRFPGAKILTLIPLFIFFTTVELPAVVILVYWFVIQFVSGAASIGSEGGGVAWWAHIGGFIAGAALMWRRPRRRRLRRPISTNPRRAVW